MKAYFPTIKKIAFEGPDCRNPLAFKHYNASERVLGKPMVEHLRFAVCYWHTFKGTGADPFGPGTMIREYNAAGDEMQVAEATLRFAFEFFSKLGVAFWCFHDRDIAPEASAAEGGLAETNRRLDRIVELAKKLQADTGLRPLWGTANLFSNRRYLAGAATNPSPQVFAYAAAQVKKALDITHALGGAGYVFWGGREGYDTLLNTDLKRELDHLGRFLHLAVDYKRQIGFAGPFYIEPKPKEPTKHQYDSDAAACYAFLQKYELVPHFKLNIEANHATLAGHSFQHELAFCVANGILGSVDANRGDELLGWDTDQFPTDLYQTALAMYTILGGGGFTTGGLNFDAKVRRQSIDPVDLFHAHIGAMDAFARGLKIAARLIQDRALAEFVSQRYAGWDTAFGHDLAAGKLSLKDLEAHTLKAGEPGVASGRQEMLENILNEYIC